MKKLISIFALFASLAFGQFTPPPAGAYISSDGTFIPAPSTQTLNALSFTPPPAALYCFNTSTGKWVPADSSCFGGAGTVTSIATTGPITGGTITATGTIACATCVVASSPGTGIAHFAGSTQTVTSSAVSLTADVSGVLPAANGGTNTASTAFSALTDGATVTWATSSALIANASLLFTTHGGSRTLNLTGLVNGGSYVLELTQDATGGEGLTLGSGCTWKVSGGGSGAITPSTGANVIDVLAFTYDGTNCYANFNKNFN